MLIRILPYYHTPSQEILALIWPPRLTGCWEPIAYLKRSSFKSGLLDMVAQFSLRRYLSTPLSEVSSMLLSGTVPMLVSCWRWPCLVVSRQSFIRCLFLCLFSGNLWCGVLSLTWCLWLLDTSDVPRRKPLVTVAFPPVYLLGRFSWPQHVQSVDPQEDRCHTLSQPSLDFQFHFLQQAHRVCGWWHVWSGCPFSRQSSGEHVWLLPRPLSNKAGRSYQRHFIHGC